MTEKSFILSWLIIGLIGAIICAINDMRDKEYDPKEFDAGYYMAIGTVICLGYLCLFPIIFYCIKKKYNIKSFGYYIHKLVNIGVKKERK